MIHHRPRNRRCLVEPGADITGGQNARDRCLQLAWVAMSQRPAPGTFGIRSGGQVAQVVFRDVLRKPCTVRIVPPIKTKIARRGQPRIGRAVAMGKSQFFDVRSAVDLGDFGIHMHNDIFRGADAGGEVIGHARTKRRATNEQMHCAGAAISEEHRGLAGGVAGADHGNILVFIEIPFDGGAGVMDAGGTEAIGPLGDQLCQLRRWQRESYERSSRATAVQLKPVRLVRTGGRK